MALVLKDRVKETTTTTGTGTITLAGAVSGYQSFSVIGNANTTYYTIVDPATGAWEVGLGTYTLSGTTLSRDTVLESSNSGSLVNFGAGAKDVFVTYPAERAVVSGTTDYLSLPAPSTSGNVLTSNGSAWTSSAPTSSSTLTIDNKTATYTVVAADAGKVINVTSGSPTINLDPAATLGRGFNVTIWNNSATATDTTTIDPSGAETVDGVFQLYLKRGEGTQIVSDGTNWQTGAKKTMRGYGENIVANDTRPFASGASAIAIGPSATATAAYSMGIGTYAQASASYSYAIGGNSLGGAKTNATGAVALGASYASGGDSFAAGIGSNSASYGAKVANSIAMGSQATANGTTAIAIGALASATGANSVVICSDNASGSSASGAGSYAIGGYNPSATVNYAGVIGGNAARATGFYSLVLNGDGAEAIQQQAFARGTNTSANAYGKYAYGLATFSTKGYCQISNMGLCRATTNATATVLTADNGTPSSTNQVLLLNNTAIAFTGIVVARQQAASGTASAAWKIEGLIRREATAATTTLVNSALTVVSNVPGWAIALSADTVNGCLAVTVTGAAATNIRWVANIEAAEVGYA